MYDIIGDVHGQFEKLEELLAQMGYTKTDGIWSHPERKAYFVGDLADRGAGQIQTFQLVRDMVEAGHAVMVMGNHEFNAISYATVDPLNPSEYLRKRTQSNTRTHQAFLDAVGVDSATHQEWIAWFKTLPLWFENDDIRLVHACWHQPLMDQLAPLLHDDHTLPDRVIEQAARKGTFERKAVEVICKGVEVDLPPNVSFTDHQGIVRTKTRVKWWDKDANTYSTATLERDSTFPDEPLPKDTFVVYDNHKPVFFGHYWFTGTPQLISNHICCVDYSAAKDHHPLVAYRFNGEAVLSVTNFVSTPVTPRHKMK